MAAKLDEKGSLPEGRCGFVRQVSTCRNKDAEDAFQGRDHRRPRPSRPTATSRRLGGELEGKHTLEGWGHSYYRLDKVSGPMSTIRPAPARRRSSASSRWSAKAFLLRYNSKLPIVVYAPKDFEVRYRILVGVRKGRGKRSANKRRA
ncbi:ecotin family protein [Pseudomonas aeruginosa]|nr:ecotin family protein [Pseudomonas aeruginosa]